MPLSKLVEQVAIHVIELYKQYQTPVLLYHNLEHTQNVVMRTDEIASNYSLNKTELCILSVAAWFHDTGQLFGEAEQRIPAGNHILPSNLRAFSFAR